MALISYSIYNNEYIKSIRFTNSNRKQTSVFTGILDYSKSEEISLETFNKKAPAYIDINPSINQNGGAEYSYNFWVCFNKNPSTSTLTQYTGTPTGQQAVLLPYTYMILFYKGEKNTLPYTSFGYECEKTTLISDLDNRILIKNPLVKIRNDGQEIIVEYNNINYPDTFNNSSTTIDCSISSIVDVVKLASNRSKNKFGIKDIQYNEYGQVFNMVTILFQENQKGSDSINVNNTNCKIYLNGALVADRLANVNGFEDTIVNNFNSRVMKSNLSKFYINPYSLNLAKTNQLNLRPNSFIAPDGITSVSPLLVSDLSYFNYALDDYEISNLYRLGFNNYPAILPVTEQSIYNKGFNFGDSLPNMV
jgi:hypothetical protein